MIQRQVIRCRGCEAANTKTPGPALALGEGATAGPGKLVITAHGTPAPQGSKLRTRFGLVDDNAKSLKPWRKAVTTAALAECRRVPWMWRPLAGPVFVDATITLARPAAHYRTGRYAHVLRDNAPTWPIGVGRGDVDKYARALLDALTDADVWRDDVQVVELVARKVYVDSGLDALQRPGAVIRVWPAL